MRTEREQLILDRCLLDNPVLYKLQRLKNWKFLHEFGVEVAKHLIQETFPEPAVELRRSADPGIELAFKYWDAIKLKDEWIDRELDDGMNEELRESQKSFSHDRSKEGRLIRYLLEIGAMSCALNVISVVRDMYVPRQWGGSEEDRDKYIWMFNILARKYNHLTAKDLLEESQRG